MADEIENTDSNNGDNPNQDLDGLDEAALKELTIKERGIKTELEDKNKQLFERAKKAEGFELKDGEWIKPEPKDKKKPEKKTDKTDDSELLQRLDKMSLRSSKITDEDEVELANNFKKRTGLEMDEVIDDDIFIDRLEKLREEKANKVATSNIKGGAGESKVKDSPEYWEAKGTRPTREDIPDRKTRVKIIRALMKNAKTGGKQFHND